MSGHIRRREIEAGTRYYPVLDIEGRRRTANTSGNLRLR